MVAKLRRLDLACSRFRDDSELVALNRAAGAPLQVSETLFGALEAALRCARVSGGLVDPTVGRALRLAGYDRTLAQLQLRDGRRFWPAFEPAGRYAEIELDSSARTVCLPDDVELDLGASAKAFAADAIAAAASAVLDGAGVLVSVGGDVATAGEPPAQGWPIRLASDHRAPLEAPGPVVLISGGGLASSTTRLRRWSSARGTLHHILDPRTGKPARSPWATVNVSAGSCLDANAAALSAIVLGDDASGWLTQHALAARLVAHSGAVVRTGGWPLEAAA